ncbi:MAG TPA: kelch repeat-containing protein [Bacteroidales bacterium]|nr:kelch repeat-containing protein [Bacteroidales bacterium]
MKKICSLVLLLVSCNLFSQGYWTQKADFGGTPKYWAVGFAAGVKGYAGLGRGLGFTNSSDLWEYNPGTNIWTQKSSFPGGARYSSHVFVINNKAYFCSGAYWSGAPGGYTPYHDVWEYNPSTDTWTQKNNFPGPGRHDAFAFSFAGKGYLCFGQDSTQNRLNDLWEYNPATDTWIQKAAFPGTARSGGIQFGFGKYGYIGLGRDNNNVSLGDIWRYDCATNTWSQMANFPGASRTSASTFVLDRRAYVVCGYNFQTSSYTKELWEYNPDTDTWVQRETFTGTGRACGTPFAINNRGFFGMGNTNNTFYKDLWEYTPWCLDSVNTDVSLTGTTINANASGAVYQWLNCDSAFAQVSNATGQSFTPAWAGNYAVIITQDVCVDTSDCIEVSCFDTINTAVTLSGMTIYSLAPGASYQWLNCDIGFAVIDNETNQSYSPPVDGNYAVVVTQGNCSDTSECITFSAYGIDETENVNVLIYLNPLQNEIIVDVKAGEVKSALILTDMYGRIVRTFHVSSSGFHKFNTGFISGGIYLVSFETDHGKVVKKFFVSE